MHQNCFDFSKICFVSKIQFCSHTLILTNQRLVMLPSSDFSKYNMFFQTLTCCFIIVLKLFFEKLFWFEFYKRIVVSQFNPSLAITKCLLFISFSKVLKWVLFFESFWKFLCCFLHWLEIIFWVSKVCITRCFLSLISFSV